MARPFPSLVAPPPLDRARSALFLDLDGTLAVIEPHPDAVGPDRRRSDVLARLDAALSGRLAVVSGRSLSDIDRILGGEVRAAAGIHGLDRRRADGSRVTSATGPGPGLAAARADLRALLGGRPGLLIEDKGLAVAVHFRQAPELASEVADVTAAIAAGSALELQPGDMVVELRPPGCDKGGAIKAFMSEPPFMGATPVFVGDDLTDESGFRAVAELGGFGILVGPPRSTGALYRLDGVEAVMGWLRAAVYEGAS